MLFTPKAIQKKKSGFAADRGGRKTSVPHLRSNALWITIISVATTHDDDQHRCPQSPRDVERDRSFTCVVSTSRHPRLYDIVLRELEQGRLLHPFIIRCLEFHAVNGHELFPKSSCRRQDLDPLSKIFFDGVHVRHVRQAMLYPLKPYQKKRPATLIEVWPSSPAARRSSTTTLLPLRAARRVRPWR